MIPSKSILAFTLSLAASSAALADEKDDRIKAAWEAADKAAIQGPADVTLKDQAKLKLADDLEFVPQAQGKALMKAFGNGEDDNLVGIVVPKSAEENWVLTIDHTADGYVNDEEAKKWNAEDLLKSLSEGTEAGNEDRIKQGFPALKVDGWVEPPAYDSAAHKLVWSMRLKHRDEPHQGPATVNYNTYALGRDGYFELDLLTNESKIEAQKPVAKSILAALQYNQGKRYEDFNSSTDHMAEYGIAALVGGLAAKKLGLIALAGVFVLKFIKIIGIAVVVALGGLKRFFTGRKTPSV